MNKPTKLYRPDRILMSDPPSVILENWATDLCKDGLYLVGNVYGHPRFADGESIRTKRVRWMLDDVGIAQTVTTNFILRNRR